MTSGMPDWLEPRLACPDCRRPLERSAAGGYRCQPCGRDFPSHDGIPVLKPSGVAGELPHHGHHFDEIASIYDETIPGHVREHYLGKRLELLRRVVGQGPILDVGCGTGVLLQRIAAWEPAAVGVDASAEMLAVMRGRALPAVCALSSRLPFLDDTFATVFCVALLHHLADPKVVAATIHEMVRVTRPGGAVVLIDHNPLNPYWPLLMRRVPQDDGTERLVPLGELLRAVRSARGEPVGIYRLGFMPDFMPRPLLPLARRAERFLEGAPLLRKLAAHNVVVARKP